MLLLSLAEIAISISQGLTRGYLDPSIYSAKSKERNDAPETHLSHFPIEFDAFKYTFDCKACTTNTRTRTPATDRLLDCHGDLY